jgi:hypothetical protein
MSHDDHEVEPIPGLPALPPEGETILWQGSPYWPTVARRVMHLDMVAVYLALLIAWRAVGQRGAGRSGIDIAMSLLPMVGLSLLALGLLALIAWGIGRTTVYTITNRRIALRFGIALPITFNLPFRAIGAANLRDLGHGRGDIALRLTDEQRIAYLVLWPHARPWQLRTPEPMLRALPDVAKVATLLGEALAADMSRQRIIRPLDGAVTEPRAMPVSRPALVAAE